MSAYSIGFENVECRVCNDVFSLQGEKVPRLLHCGHTVCHQCLMRLRAGDETILCPFDRQPTIIGDSGVWGLKKNFALLELLERLQSSPSSHFLHINKAKNANEDNKEPAILCDEHEQHMAVIYCITCSTHLCLECSERTHATRTLARHKRVPLAEKPREIPHCVHHPAHLVEFACQEVECSSAPLMCYICKDYGRHAKHKHTLLETEACNVKSSITNAAQQMRLFSQEVSEWNKKLSYCLLHMEGGNQVVDENGSGHRSVQVQSTITLAREKVRGYFAELFERLQQQEVAATAVVDAFVRERLATLKQQQEDLNTLLAQINTVCMQCEQTLVQDDARIIMAKLEVQRLIETVKKQQQQFADLPEQLNLDPNIPLTFTRDNHVHIGPKMEMRVIMLGLDGAGKTSILFQLKQKEFINTIPTIGFNVETLEYKNMKFTVWDVGGQPKLRPLWKHYFLNTQALIYVVDSSCADRTTEACNELNKLLQEKELKDASLLILANKQDVQPCAAIEELVEKFNVLKMCGSRSWHVQACDARFGNGLVDGLEWLSHQLVNVLAGPSE